MSIAAYLGELMRDMIAAIEIHTRYRTEAPASPPPGELDAIFRGDASFRALVIFLDHAREVLKTAAPRSAVAVRST